MTLVTVRLSLSIFANFLAEMIFGLLRLKNINGITELVGCLVILYSRYVTSYYKMVSILTLTSDAADGYIFVLIYFGRIFPRTLILSMFL